MVIIKRTIVPVLILIGIAGIAVFIVFDPAGSVFFPKCPFRLLTGWDCPGCGSQRTLHALLHGQVSEAFMYNPLLVLSLPYLGTASYLEYFNGKKRFPRLRQVLMGRTACIVILCVIVLYWIGRNVI